MRGDELISAAARVLSAAPPCEKHQLKSVLRQQSHLLLHKQLSKATAGNQTAQPCDLHTNKVISDPASSALPARAPGPPEVWVPPSVCLSC